MEKRKELIRRDWKNYGTGITMAGIYILTAGVILKFPICPMSFFTGFPCPACGITRAAELFLTGDFAGAWQMHPFFNVLLIWLIGAGVLRYGMLKRIGWMKYLAAVVAAGAIAFYIYRMWAYFPRTEPMVYNYGSVLGLIKKLQILR